MHYRSHAAGFAEEEMHGEQEQAKGNGAAGATTADISWPERQALEPPLPTVPCRLRREKRPFTVSGKSVSMSPLTVLALTSAERDAGARL